MNGDAVYLALIARAEAAEAALREMSETLMKLVEPDETGEVRIADNDFSLIEEIRRIANRASQQKDKD